MILKALLSGRWLIAFMVLPYALLWARAADSGGVLMALLVTALLLFYFACLDEIHVTRLDETRLGFVRGRGLVDPEAAGIAKYLFGGIAKVLAIVLLFVQPWVGLAGLIALTAIWIASLSTRRWPVKTLWSEILIPLCAMMLPMILVGFFARREVGSIVGGSATPDQQIGLLGVSGGLVSPGVHLATVVGAAMLAGYLLLCAMRDEPADRGSGLLTSVVVLGRPRAGLGFFLLGAAVTAVAIRGSGAVVRYGAFHGTDTLRTAWPWSIAVFVAVLSMFGVLLTAEREDALAVGIWGAGAIAVGLFLNISVY